MSIRAFIDAIKSLAEEGYVELFESPELQKELQEAALVFPGGDVYEWMQENKNSWTFWAFIHRVINNRMSIKVNLNTGHEAFISPTADQIFEDGVTFLQGPKRMEGLICGYKDGKISVAHARRDIAEGTEFSGEDLEFVELDEDGQLAGKTEQTYSFEEAGRCLDALIKTERNNESAFQDYFTRFPWVFGLQYKKVQSHQKFDDENIPDFSAVSARTSLRDIIEIKPPGLRLFGKGNSLLAAFHSSVTQCERYIDFADANRDYLRREKGLLFDRPIAILVAGYDLPEKCLIELRRKERLNPRLRVYTYNDIRASIKSMQNVIQQLSESSKPDEPDTPTEP
jgi:hypothetical protein